jgi:hypothetical protein
LQSCEASSKCSLKNVTKNKIPVFIFCTTFFYEIFLVLGKKRDKIKMCIGLPVNYHYSSQMLIRLEFSRRTSQTWSIIKFHDNLSHFSRVVSCGQKEAANSRFS